MGRLGLRMLATAYLPIYEGEDTHGRERESGTDASLNGGELHLLELWDP